MKTILSMAIYMGYSELSGDRRGALGTTCDVLKRALQNDFAPITLGKGNRRNSRLSRR
jgi:hypothetical protein